ncbi:hypothetical protein [Cutibacterium sp. V947]|uniref:hypothetical protein n=1 Tax=Cutibacterium sp. V947 TaxID=3446480 RepID=UPI003EDFD2BC
MTSRILVTEDSELVAEALLPTEPEFEIIHRVARGDGLVTAATGLMSDLVLADIDLPGAYWYRGRQNPVRHGGTKAASFF